MDNKDTLVKCFDELHDALCLKVADYLKNKVGVIKLEEMVAVISAVLTSMMCNNLAFGCNTLEQFNNLINENLEITREEFKRFAKDDFNRMKGNIKK